MFLFPCEQFPAAELVAAGQLGLERSEHLECENMAKEAFTEQFRLPPTEWEKADPNVRFNLLDAAAPYAKKLRKE